MQRHGTQTGKHKSKLSLSINCHLKFGGKSDNKGGINFILRAGTGHLKWLMKNACAASRH